MKNIFSDHHPRKHAKSFKYAFSGLLHTLLNEANFRVQILIAVVSIFLGFKYHINEAEWGLLVIVNGLLLSAEVINTVVENFIDVLIAEHNEGAKLIKDISAGFVLITAITFLIVFLLIFGKNFIQFFI